MFEQPAVDTAEQFGARIYPLDGKTILIKQTHKSHQSGEYVVSIDKQTQKHLERHVDLSDDSEIGKAIRDALQGVLGK